MRFAHAKRDRLLHLDMTPMIDIVFQLLIFFLTTAQMAQMTRTKLELPDERGEEEKSQDLAGLVINLDASGMIVVNDATVSLAELEALVADLAVRQGPAGFGAGAANVSAFRPLVRADRNAPAERLNSVINALERVGVKAIRIGTSPTGGERRKAGG
jgi:biopolymer transport protein ExbD